MSNNSMEEQAKNPITLTIHSTQYTVTPGGSTTITVKLENHGAEEDYYELSVKGIPTNWVSMPSPVTQLPAGGKIELMISILAPPAPQSRVGRYTINIEATSQTNPEIKSEVEATLTVAAFEVKGRVGILMESTQFSVAPGSSTTVALVLRNQGLEEDHFNLSVEGVPTSWISTSSPVTLLDAGDERQITLTIQPPRTPDSRAGRHAIKIGVTSQADPSQVVVVDCTLTVGAYTEFASRLHPQRLEPEQTGWVVVSNKGNIQDVYTISLMSDEDRLSFEPAPVQELRLPAGESGRVEFTPEPVQRPWFGREEVYPYGAQVKNTAGETETLNGEATSSGLIPVWILPVALVLCLGIICISVFLFNQLTTSQEGASATQTAVYSLSATQTAMANMGLQDSDGDGLSDSKEIEIGTDPFNPDTDADELLDGDEVLRGTDPLNPDTDGDGLSEGEEVLRRATDPLNPDTDGDVLRDGDEVQRGTDPLIPDSDSDGLMDGDEVQRGTDPLNPDTDGDKLIDGEEVRIGTNPLNPDSDNDRLIDGDETPPCPDPLNPDTDGDGILDGIDLDPCDPNNPSMTATAASGIPTETQPVPTVTATVAATNTLVPTDEATLEPTEPPGISVSGFIAFVSTRHGNQEIYSMNAANFNITQLTIDPGVDFQPTWSPDGTQIAFSTNRDGNYEIYVMNADGTGIFNLTNDPAEDQYPTWSPDGDWIAFTSNRDGNREIYSIRFDGTQLTNISNNGADDFDPTWFKEGGVLSSDLIAFVSTRDGNQEIYTMKVDGSEQTNISNNGASDSSPAGSPKGEWIAFTSNRGGNSDIYLMRTDGTSLSNLTNSPAEDSSPAWAIIGQWIAFTSNRSGNNDIFAMNADGSQQTNMTNDPADDNSPSWY